MKDLVFLKMYPSNIGGSEKYLSRLILALNKIGVPSITRTFKGKKKINSVLRALLFNKQVSKQKDSNELYFSLERVDSADIYRAGDGVHKVYRNIKKRWFFNPINYVYPYLEKKCFENSKLIIANSKLIKDQIIQTYKISEDKIKVIYNGVHLPKNLKKGVSKIALCDKLAFDYEAPIILFIGNGFERKGLKEFLTILSQIQSSYNAIIIGNDKNMKKYKNLAKKLKVRAAFLGELRDVSEYYAGADLLILPTRYDPFSNVVLEAMSYECAVITTAQNGACEIIDKEYVLKSSNDENGAKIADELLFNADLLREVGIRNYTKASDFTIEKNAELTMQTINAFIR